MSSMERPSVSRVSSMTPSDLAILPPITAKPSRPQATPSARSLPAAREKLLRYTPEASLVCRLFRRPSRSPSDEMISQ